MFFAPKFTCGIKGRSIPNGSGGGVKQTSWR
ncbi:hypothetical protein J2W92_005186 [Rhizobium leguminosarum]